MSALKKFLSCGLCAVLSFWLLQAEGARLTSQQSKVYRGVLAEEFCDCTSALTLAGCLKRRPGCPLAPVLAEIVQVGAQGNVSQDELLDYMATEVTTPFCQKAVSFNLLKAPSRGAHDAPLTVVEFADFRCTHCKEAAHTVKKALEAHRDVRFVFMPFPLGNHPLSVDAAKAALAAQAQGKFWAMHDMLFERQEHDFSSIEVNLAAKRAKLDLKRFKEDMVSPTLDRRVKAMKEQGRKAGVAGTPHFFVNGRTYHLDTLVQTFERRLAMERHRNHKECQ
jgi:protein-disulfide isomerase